MKIVLVCRATVSHRPGGMTHVLADRSQALAKLGHEVHVLTTAKKPEAKEVEVEEMFGYTTHFLPAPVGLYSKQFADECEALCRKLSPKVIHLESFDASHKWYLGRPGGAKRVATTLHGFGMGSFLTLWNMYLQGIGNPPEFPGERMRNEAWAMRSFDRVIGISLHEHWMLSVGYGLRNVSLVYNPIDEIFFSSPPVQAADASSPWICVAISGHRQRGFDRAMRMAEEAGVQVQIIDSVHRREMPAVYDRSRGLLLLSYYQQGYDLTVAEAISRGRPVVAYYTGSYAREAEYLKSLHTHPLGPLPRKWFESASFHSEDLVTIHRHHPKQHTEAWLEAVCP